MTTETPGPAPDEKLCPFCAETIKAAAIKCRFCQSDLTDAPPAEVQPAAAVEPSRDVEQAAEVEPSETPWAEDDESGPTSTSSARVVAALVVLCLVLGGVLGFLVHRSRNPALDTAPDGQVTANSFRNAAMSAASDAATKALSYSYKTFDQDRKQARALMGPTLAKQYDAAMNQVQAQTASTRLTLKATVLSAGLISIEEHKAKVLLFVNTVTTRAGSSAQQLDQNRVLMQLTRKDGGWTVSKMDAF